MDAHSSEAKFQQADQLYQADRFAEALSLLEELNRAHPHRKNILYPMAMCLEGLERYGEALALCEQLIQEFQDERAHVIKARIITIP